MNDIPVPGPNLVTLVEQGVPMSIIRGMNMGTIGHAEGYVYMLTGEPSVGSSARGTSIPIRLAALSGAAGKPVVETVVPTLAMGVDSYTGSEKGRYGAPCSATSMTWGASLRARPRSPRPRASSRPSRRTRHARRPPGPPITTRSGSSVRSRRQ